MSVSVSLCLQASSPSAQLLATLKQALQPITADANTIATPPLPTQSPALPTTQQPHPASLSPPLLLDPHVTAAALASARAVLASLEASTARIQGDVRACRGELSAREAEQQASQRAMDEAEATARQLRADIAELEQQLATKRARLRDVESGMADGGAMRQQLQQAQQRVGVQRDLVSELERQQREVDGLVAEGRRLVESAAAGVQQMQEMDEAMERAVSEVSGVVPVRGMYHIDS